VPRNDAVGGLKEGLTGDVREISTEVKHIATDIVDEAKHVAEVKLRDGKNFAGDQLGTVAWALRSTSESLREKESPISDYVDKAAASIDDASIYLATRTLGQLIGDIEDYARREPAMFLGGAFLAGLLGSRLFKAAKPRPASATERSTPSQYPPSSTSTPSQYARGSTSTSTSASSPPPTSNDKPTPPNNDKGPGAA
jgi:hypothetical protein